MFFPMALAQSAFTARLFALVLASATGVRASLWVSPKGDDRNPGSEEQPLRTIERARDLVRTLNHDMSDDITVFIGGTYQVTRPIEFGPEDSGTNGFSIVYTAAPGEHPVLTGGFRVGGWTLADRSRSLWWAPAPEGLADSRDLFVNGVPASRTRGRLLQAFARDTAGASDIPESKPHWKNPDDVLFPPAEAAAIWSERLGTPPFFVVNAFELLGTPGEWYFDRPAGRIYYTPRYGEDMAAADVEAAQAGTLIEGNGTQVRPVTGLIFKGIRFEYTSLPRSFDVDYTRSRPAGAPAAAVRFTFAGGIQFLEDEFVHLGTPALDLGPGLEGGTVEACVFGDISWTALRIADASQVRVDNSRFSYVDFAQDDGAAIELDHSQAVVIEHDQFDHYPRFAILPQGSQFGANHKAMNLMMPPAIDFDGRPPEQDPRDSAAPDAGVLAAYRSVLAERFCSPTVPHAPGNVSAAPGDRLAYVTWDPPCLDGSSAVESYTVASSGGATITVTAAAFRKTGYVIFSGLENGHAMNFTVAATNATGAGPHSIPTANVIPQRKKKHKPPPPPKAASVETSGGLARIEIIPPVSDGGSPVLAYSVASLPSVKWVLLEGWDVIHSNAADPVVRTIGGYSLGPGSTIAISATNAAGEGKAATLKLQR